MPRYCFLFFALAFTTFWTSVITAQIPTCELDGLNPAAIQSGTRSEIRIGGRNLEESHQLIITDPQGNRLSVGIENQPAKLGLLREHAEPTDRFVIDVEAETETGLCEVRSLGRFGLSNPRPLVITRQPVFIPPNPASDPAQRLTLPTDQIVFDHLPSKASRFYQVDIAPDQQFQCVAYTQQIDSHAALIMTLRNGDGQVVGRGRSIGDWPAELEFDQAGSYVLEVHDLIFSGGESHPYLLEGKLRPQPSPQQQRDDTDASTDPLELNRLLRPRLQSERQLTQLAPFLAPNAAFFSEPVATETTADDFSAQEPLTNFPANIQGDFHDPKPIDISVSQGRTLTLDVASARLGQLTDPRLLLYQLVTKADGSIEPRRLAEQDDGPTVGNPGMRLRQLDPFLSWTAPQDGNYRIVVLDNQSGKRPADARGYWLRIRDAAPSFAVLAYRSYPTNDPAGSRPWGSQLLPGGSESIGVLVVRAPGFNGPVEIRLQRPPAGVRCPPVIIPAGANEGQLILTATKVEPWHGTLKIVGQAMGLDMVPEIEAQYATFTAPAVPTRNAVQTRRSLQLFACIQTADAFPVQIDFDGMESLSGGVGTKIPIKARAHRQENMQVECILRAQHLPSKVSVGEIRIPGDQAEAVAEINVAADAAPGEYTLWFQAEMKINWQRNPEALTRQQAYVEKLKHALEDPDAEGTSPEALQAALTEATVRLEQLQKQAAAQQRTVWMPIGPLRLTVQPAA